MAIRRFSGNFEDLKVGDIVLIHGLLTHSICGQPRRVCVVNKSRLVLDLIQRGDVKESAPKVRYVKSVLYVADTEDEAFDLWNASMRFSRYAEETLKKANDHLDGYKMELLREIIQFSGH